MAKKRKRTSHEYRVYKSSIVEPDFTLRAKDYNRAMDKALEKEGIFVVRKDVDDRRLRQMEVAVRGYAREKNGKPEDVTAHTRRQMVRTDVGAAPAMMPLSRPPSAVRTREDERQIPPTIERVFHSEGAELFYHSPFFQVDSSTFESAVRAIGPYNEYSPETLLTAKNYLPDDIWVSVGREYSPVFYFKSRTDDPVELERIRRALEDVARPDELDITSFEDMQVGSASREAAQALGLRPGQKLVRAWWD